MPRAVTSLRADAVNNAVSVSVPRLQTGNKIEWLKADWISSNKDVPLLPGTWYDVIQTVWWRWLSCVCVCVYIYFYCYGMLHYLLTHSTVQSRSWEANRFSASQEIPRISRNPKVHYRTHKRPPRVPILGQPNPVHIPTSPLLEIHPNIILPSAPISPKWSLSFSLPHRYPVYASAPLVPHAWHITFFSIWSPAQSCVRSTHR